MKFLKFNLLFAMTVVLLLSCSKDDDKVQPPNQDETKNLHLIESFSESGYTVELFTSSEPLKVGYNKIFLRLSDEEGDPVEQVSWNWMPMMTMEMNGMSHQHSSPFSDISKVSGKETLFEGYIVFIMPSDAPTNVWELKIHFSVEGQNFEVNEKVNVISTDSEFNKIYTSGMGSDGTTYHLALIEPATPEIGPNNMVVALFKKGENHDFPIVDDFSIKVDPRMPAMGNHSAPGNEDLIQKEDGFYHGKVGFSMTGYWKINMILENSTGEVVKGEPVTEQNPESSLNFKLEF